jgi:outer membrane protein OmpA-like peptidoglycan-associated protein
MKKVMVVSGCIAMTFAVSTLSHGIELTTQGADSLKGSIHGIYVTDVKDGKIAYTEKATAYRPSELDTILKAYGLTLDSSKVSTLPAGFVTTKDGKTEFGEAATAYTPNNYHSIFTAYGLQLDVACIKATIGKINYALTATDDGKYTLGDSSTAYTGENYAKILSCYNLPEKPKKMEKKAVAQPKPEHTTWVMASDYLFDFNKAVIKKQYYSQLDKIAEQIKSDPSMRVEVQGHTDSIGSEKYNMALSKKRANAVRNYLIKKDGIAAKRLTAVGFGKTKPIASNATEEGRAKNRRVELKPLD